MLVPGQNLMQISEFCLKTMFFLLTCGQFGSVPHIRAESVEVMTLVILGMHDCSHPDSPTRDHLPFIQPRLVIFSCVKSAGNSSRSFSYFPTYRKCKVSPEWKGNSKTLRGDCCKLQS